ncbi:MAG: 4-hydroxy-3-methylbut-2-enyl diphosphate reductase [Gemmatimonadetes bacterium]|nr:MAG: 4-hydroxy-3-methylbut-2-enyl diphosphate reductase [Gemmatimonadota bacterium]
MKTIKLYLAAPRGFCAGVVRAIDIVETALKKFGAPVYMKHQIVHNEHVVNELTAKGAVFVEDFDDIPPGSVVIFSAHGVPPSAHRIAAERHLKAIDATCPLVTKVHRQVTRYNDNDYQIVMIGHKNHVEVIGTMGHAPERTVLVETVEDVQNLNLTAEKIAFTTQTTLSYDDTAEIIDALKEKYPHIEGPKADDICYATQNRQNAVKAFANQCDLILVLGSKSSSNSNRLAEVGRYQGVPAHLIASADTIDPAWLDNVNSVGITSGASTPEVLVQETINWFKSMYDRVDLEEVIIEREHITFGLPKELTFEN